MTALALEANGLAKRFGALVVTDDVTLKVPIGARLALIGPNGAGKTTLVGLLTGLLRPDAGTVVLNGRDVTSHAPARRVKQGLVRTFQINNLFRGLTILENVFLAVSEHAGASFSPRPVVSLCSSTCTASTVPVESIATSSRIGPP